jgi:hypothetical protein
MANYIVRPTWGEHERVPLKTILDGGRRASAGLLLVERLKKWTSQALQN